jgi:toxin co-regulated pilus biosynthesis protein Q
MKKAPSLVLAAIAMLACAAAGAQSVRTSPEAFPIAPPPLQLPVAPAAASGALPVVPPARSVAPAPAPVQQEWRIELADASLSRALRRWARDARYPVMWEAPKDLPAVAASYKGDFLAALTKVMEDSQQSAYPLHACAYDNVVRVLHVSQACNR